MRKKTLLTLSLLTSFSCLCIANALAQCPPNCKKSSQSSGGNSQQVQATSTDNYKKLAYGYSVAVQKGAELQATLSQRQKQFGDKLKETGKSLLDKIIDEGVQELTKDSGTRSTPKSKSSTDWKSHLKALNVIYQRVNDYNEILDNIKNTADSLVDLQSDTTELELKLQRLDSKLQKMRMEDKNNPNQKHNSNEYKQLTREYLETVKEASLLNAKINDKQSEFGQRMGDTSKELVSKTIDKGVDLLTKSKDSSGKKTKGKTKIDWGEKIKDTKDRILEYKKLIEDAAAQADNYIDSKNDLAEFELKLQKLDSELQRLRMADSKARNSRPTTKTDRIIPAPTDTDAAANSSPTAEASSKAARPRTVTSPLSKQEQTLQKLKRYLENTLSSIDLAKSLRDSGIFVLSPVEANNSGKVKIKGNSRDGFTKTDVHIQNETNDWHMVGPFSEAYLIPANSGSTSQRIGLVSVVEKQAMNLHRENNDRFSQLLAEGGDRPRKGGPLLVDEEDSLNTPPFEVDQPPSQNGGEPTAWAYKNWVILAPGANVVIPFHSVCLDHNRATPTNGEGFYLSARPLPERIQQILANAAMNGLVPQSEVWGTIGKEHIRWFDPRVSIESLMAQAKEHHKNNRYQETIEICTYVTSENPKNWEALALLGFSYYGLGESNTNGPNAAKYFSESVTYLFKSIELGTEISLGVGHHHNQVIDQAMCWGALKLSKESLSFRSADTAKHNFQVQYNNIRELFLEPEKAGRLHMVIDVRVGNKEKSQTYNFHPYQVTLGRGTVMLSPNAPYSYNQMHCPNGCHLATEAIYKLINKLAP